ncbi:2-C-methyl-D-erythritol 4-phosphate cytidylyltransferase [Oleidesulfovibrio sp.]|uniref:2-C-methyl-D-erythritol 4-phosphate cytidylyltransferase n=1 Tax=Oleidesulfovibrio sp. TaxID=2909707 RepID=UPI003A86E963
MHTWAVLLAAGKGARISEACGRTRKQFIEWNGAPLFWHSAAMLSRIARVRGIIFVLPAEEIEAATTRLKQLDDGRALGIPWKTVCGGERRQDSVYSGLIALPEQCDHVLVHDSARPFADANLCNRILDALHNGAEGVIPALPVTDTIKVVEAGIVKTTPDRSSLVAVQTPQGFQKNVLLKAHEICRQNNWDVTDDASLLERCEDMRVQTVAGQADNIKITNAEDLSLLKQKSDAPAMLPCFGWGYDVHRFGQNGRPMKLGGVPIAGGPAVLAHSDGDVLLHALMDAVLGCMAMGDIGMLFPDTDAAFDNADSSVLLNEVLEKVRNEGLLITHIDLTIITQIPRIGPWRDQIHKNICRLTRIQAGQVNVKATTEEKLGFTGEKKGIKAVAAVTGLRPALS